MKNVMSDLDRDVADLREALNHSAYPGPRNAALDRILARLEAAEEALSPNGRVLLTRITELEAEVERLRAALRDAHEALDESFMGIPEPVRAALDDYYKAFDPKPRWASLVDVETYDRLWQAAERAGRALGGSEKAEWT